MRSLHSIAGLLLLIGTTFSLAASGQDSSSVTGLKQTIKRLESKPGYAADTTYINALLDLAYLYSISDPDSALLILAGNAERCKAAGYKRAEVKTYMITGNAFAAKDRYNKALENFDKSYRLAKENDFGTLLSPTLNSIGTVYFNQGRYAEALSKFYESLKTAEAIHDNELTGTALNNIATVQFYQNQFTEAESTYTQRLQMAQDMHDTNSISIVYNNLGEVALKQNNPGKALRHLTLAYNLALQTGNRDMLLNATLSIAEVYYELDSVQKSKALFEEALQLAKQTDRNSSMCGALIGLAKADYKQGLLQEALVNGLDGLQRADSIGQVQLMRDASEIVSNIYEAVHDGSNALRYYKTYKRYSDSLNNIESQRAAASEKANYAFSKKESEFQRKALQQQWIIISVVTALLLLTIILWLINRNRSRLNHTNKELQRKNNVIETQKAKAEETLARLQDTQAQLIQAEKMASLGELTAGIAHEIQNPLNFVNNFSEVSNELMAEMKEELEKGNYEDVHVMADDVRQNLEKITHHGKRADAIVKGMLQHSRKNTGQKEPTDINALCDEYLRLSYHGLRAKDKSFNADFTTDFDDTIGKINMVSQDMGRVLLNLFNNAFYAVNEKKKGSAGSYQPSVFVQTKQAGDKAEIIVQDNGSGIPQHIIDKIFQPFFTTKPTGEGTGLGLSLSYDIVTKEHGGTINVKSKKGEGSAFIITLPV